MPLYLIVWNESVLKLDFSWFIEQLGGLLLFVMLGVVVCTVVCVVLA